jgi:hypothetical protein
MEPTQAPRYCICNRGGTTNSKNRKSSAGPEGPEPQRTRCEENFEPTLFRAAG